MMRSSDYKIFSGGRTKSTRNVKPKTFKQAFADAKKSGKKTFSFDGKRFTTRTKDENRKDQKLGSSKNVKTGKGRGTLDTGSLRSKRLESKLGSSKNVSAGKGRGTIDTGSLRSKRLASKLGSGKNVSTGRGRGTVDTGSLRSKRLSSKLGSGKNIRDTKGTGAYFQEARRSDFRTTKQKIKDLDFKDAFKDVKKSVKKKLGLNAGGRVKRKAPPTVQRALDANKGKSKATITKGIYKRLAKDRGIEYPKRRGSAKSGSAGGLKPSTILEGKLPGKKRMKGGGMAKKRYI